MAKKISNSITDHPAVIGPDHQGEVPLKLVRFLIVPLIDAAQKTFLQSELRRVANEITIEQSRMD